MRVGARQGLACHSKEIGFMTNGNTYKIGSNTFFPSGEALDLFEVFPRPRSVFFFLRHILIAAVCVFPKMFFNFLQIIRRISLSTHFVSTLKSCFS
jgi:hypothetical protein